MKSKYFLTLLLFAAPVAALQAAPHHNEGVHLAAEIVGLVKTAITPAPQTVVVVPAPAPVPPPPPAPVVVSTTVVIPDYGYGWWNGTWVPCYNNWYWFQGAWVWGGKGPRPVPPRWAPDFKRRPLPPPPRVHHRPAPMPPRVMPPHHRPAPMPPRVMPPHHRPAPPRAVPGHHRGGRPAGRW